MMEKSEVGNNTSGGDFQSRLVIFGQPTNGRQRLAEINLTRASLGDAFDNSYIALD